MEISVEWDNFVALMEKVSERLLGPFNIVMVVEPINIKISEAIMNFQVILQYSFKTKLSKIIFFFLMALRKLEPILQIVYSKAVVNQNLLTKEYDGIQKTQVLLKQIIE